MLDFFGPFAPVIVFLMSCWEIVVFVLVAWLIRVIYFPKKTENTHDQNDDTYVTNLLHVHHEQDEWHMPENRPEPSNQHTSGSGLDGTGDLYFNGTPDTPLDLMNPNHHPILDNFDPDKR